MPRRHVGSGGVLPLAAILATAACLRNAVASVSPVVAEVAEDLRMSALDYSALSTVPLICFAVAGFVSPAVVRRCGLVGATLLGLGLLLLGTAGRGVVPTFPPFLALSLLVFTGIGVGNVVLPPLVKRYFPHQAHQVTTAYLTVLSLSTFVPPLVSAPLARLTSWRWSLGSWALLVALAIVLVSLLLRAGVPGARAVPSTRPEATRPEATRPEATGHDLRSWALALLFGVSMFNVYSYFAWLPQILGDLVGWSADRASLLLAVYVALGLPLALVVPSLAARMRRPALMAVAAGVLTTAGNVGLLVHPGQGVWVWLCVCVAGMCPLLLPLGVTMLVLLSDDEQEAAALGGFAQGVGYALGAAGPLAAGLLFDRSGGWGSSLVMLSASGGVAVVAGVVLASSRGLVRPVRS